MFLPARIRKWMIVFGHESLLSVLSSLGFWGYCSVFPLPIQFSIYEWLLSFLFPFSTAWMYSSLPLFSFVAKSPLVAINENHKHYSNSHLEILLTYVLIYYCCEDTMTTSTYRGNSLLGAYGFRVWVHDYGGGEQDSWQAGMAPEQ